MPILDQHWRQLVDPSTGAPIVETFCSLIAPDMRETGYAATLYGTRWLHKVHYSLDMRTHQKHMIIDHVWVAETVASAQSPSYRDYNVNIVAAYYWDRPVQTKCNWEPLLANYTVERQDWVNHQLAPVPRPRVCADEVRGNSVYRVCR